MYGELGLDPGVDLAGSTGVIRLVSWGGSVRMCICWWCSRVYGTVCICEVACFWFNFIRRGTTYGVVSM